MKKVAWAIAMLAMVAPAAGSAGGPDDLNLGRMTAGYSYYNRPGASVATHDGDVAACLADALNVRSFQEQLRGGTGGILGALIANAQADSANRGVVSASLENCMVVRGWRVVHLDDAEGLALSALPPAELAARLAPWIGADSPHGIVVRSWHNDAALGAVNHFSLHAQHTKNGQLSLLALSTTVSTALKADNGVGAGASALAKMPIDPKWPKKSLKPETLGTAPAGSALLVVNVKGVSMRQGNGFILSRADPDPDIRPAKVDHAPDRLFAMMGTLSGGGGKFFAFAVPPGRWRIYSMFNGGIELNFCLGSPAFDVKAGEVVYAGQLDLKQDKLAPDLDLAPVRTWMAGAAAAERLRAAQYTNGSRSACAGSSIYALEFDGMPFEDGYALGSRAPR